ncbi:RNA-directed DNA polymerase, eukaryota, reverse transcriptase zinc-binding domain protein [Tanacetum coccineum]
MSSSTKQDEVINLIVREKLNIYVTFENHIKSSILDKVCSKVFGHWSWISNMKFSDKGCRIIVGWNSANVNVACVCASKQSMLCIVESSDNKSICFLTFVYAANGGHERRELWRDIDRHKFITNGHPWAISGDFNVTLNPNEHSSGSSSVTSDMMEFKECINQVEAEDLSSAGLHFTWTKNLLKVKLGDYFGILKKLDRIMVNEDFMSKYPQAHAIFMPYSIFDHNPALLIIPNGMRFKRKSFKFANYITEKEEFCKIVEDKWKDDIGGWNMYNLVK